MLDIEDDLHGQSCTLLTLQRIDWVINQLEQHYRFIADEGGLFYDNEGNRSRRCSAAMRRSGSRRSSTC